MKTIKKILYILLISLLICSCKNESSNTELIESTKIKYRKVATELDSTNTSDKLTLKQASHDIDELCYLLKTCYIDYSQMVEKGFDEKDFKKTILQKYNFDSFVYTEQMMTGIIDYLKKYINDSHFAFLKNKTAEAICQYYVIYFSNTYVKKTDNQYVVINSRDNIVNEGDIYTGKEENLFIYPSKGECVYRIGLYDKYNYKSNKTLITSINNKATRFPVNVETPLINFSEYIYNESGDIAYVRIPSFMFKNEEGETDIALINQFDEYAYKCQDKSTIIVDLRSNMGGLTSACENFLGNLFSFDNDELKIESAKNMITNIKSNTYKMSQNIYENGKNRSEQKVDYNSKYDNIDVVFFFKRNRVNKYKIRCQDFSKAVLSADSAYKGNIYILVNKNSGSASEYFIALSRHLFGDKVTVLGTNTSGCLKNINPWMFYLKNSQIGCVIPTGKITIKDYPELEGKGLNPDYWCTDEDIIDTLFYLTNNDKVKEIKLN